MWLPRVYFVRVDIAKSLLAEIIISLPTLTFELRERLFLVLARAEKAGAYRHFR